MNEYNHFPPSQYLLRVLKYWPRSALLYIQLWKGRGKKFVINIKCNKIRKDFQISPTLFKNLLFALSDLNLITFEYTPDDYIINVMGQENV
jgi:hypothetical protein